MANPAQSGSLFGRGIGFPPHIGSDGRVAWSAGEENIRQSIRIILMTAKQERLFLPEFGGDLEHFLFQPNTVATRLLIQDAIQKALLRWEPRISVEQVKVDADPEDPQAAIATITYKLVATQSTERVSLSLQLGK